MKQYLILLLICSVSLPAFSQSQSIRNFYRKYKRTENTVNFNAPGWLIRLGASIAMNHVDDPEEREALRLAKKVRKGRILIMEDRNHIDPADLDEFINDVRDENFEDLIRVRDGNETVQILIREDNDVIRNLLILVYEEDSFIMLALKTKMHTLGSTGFSFAQSNSIQSFYKKYAGYENATDINVQGWVLKLASAFSEDEKAQNTLDKITQLRILIMEDENLVTYDDRKKLTRSLKKDKFEELLQVRDGGDKIDFFLREDGGQITNLLMVVNGKDGFILLSLEGLLNLEDIKDLNIDIEGSEHLKKLPKHRA